MKAKPKAKPMMPKPVNKPTTKKKY